MFIVTNLETRLFGGVWVSRKAGTGGRNHVFTSGKGCERVEGVGQYCAKGSETDKDESVRDTFFEWKPTFQDRGQSLAGVQVFSCV